MLKLAGLGYSPVPAVGFLSSPRVGVAVAGWELLLGILLVSNLERTFAWLAAFGTFLGFAAVSGDLGAAGATSCGCFGAVKASPWAAFGVDLVAVFALVRYRPRNIVTEFASHAKSRKTRWATAALASIIALVGGVVLYFGSTGHTLAALRGESLSLSSSYLDFGAGPVGSDHSGSLRVTNHTGHPVRLIGGTSDCSCTATKTLPLTFDAGATAEVVVDFRVPPAAAGRLTRKVWLRTDLPELQQLLFRVGCLVE